MDWRMHIYPNSASSPALKVDLGHLLVATWWFSGREHSSVNAHLSSWVRRHEPVTVLYPQLFIREQFQDGSENISVCIQYLTVVCTSHSHCCMQRISSTGLYGALDTMIMIMIMIIIIIDPRVRDI